MIAEPHAPTPPEPVQTHPTLTAQRKVAESKLADEFQTQAVWLLEQSRVLRKGLPFDFDLVIERLHTFLGDDIAVVGRLQGLDELERPGASARPRAVRPPPLPARSGA